MSLIHNMKKKLSALMLAGVIPVFCKGSVPLYPVGLALSGSGELLMAEKGANRLAVYSADGGRLLRAVPLSDIPTGVAASGGKAYVTTSWSRGQVHVVSLADGHEEAVVRVGQGACAPLVDAARGKLYVCNQFQHTVTEVNLMDNRVERSEQVLREPVAMALSGDGRHLFVANFLPDQRADVSHVSACVSVIELDRFRKVKDIRLANGSNALHGLCVSPDGRYLYVAHNLGRYTVPTSQLQQGWMNTSAVSIIDVGELAYLGTVVADEPERGAAGIWGIACDEDRLFVSHSGTHEVSVIDHRKMLDKFLNSPNRSALEYDLTFFNGIRRRIPLNGNGPRALALDGKRLIVPTYFSDTLNVMDVKSGKLQAVALNPQRQESVRDKGERLFNDASRCYQGWQSCNGCHPGDGRTDGMNWDLMNDGIGNPKNCKSLLFSHVTPPCMISGIRKSAELAVRAGYRYIQFFDISEADAACVDVYLRSLQPVPSPYLVDGKLSDRAKEGRKVFNELKCGECHGGSYYTDLKTYRIGDDVEFEKGWDTPTLREVWRTAPYLFDGRAATMKDVFKVHRHGLGRKKVSEKEIDALTEYVNSL